MSWTNQSKHSASFTNQSKTDYIVNAWDDAEINWDDPTIFWDGSRVPQPWTNVTKHSASFTNLTKH